MDTKKKRSGGFGSIFFMIIIIGIVWAVIAQMSQRTSNYKYKDFESDLKSGRITDVVISQNAEVPTGLQLHSQMEAGILLMYLMLFLYRKSLMIKILHIP